MQIATSFSNSSATSTAVSEAVEVLQQKVAKEPDLLMCYFTENHAADELKSELQKHFPQTALHGASSCQGLMTESGHHGKDGSVIGLWAVYDDAGRYGSAAMAMQDNPFDAGKAAIEEAIKQAGREGESPQLVWLNATPGHEEQIIEGIQKLIGPDVPIAGGSAADNAVAGGWSVFSNKTSLTEGITVSVFFPSGEISYAFHSGYLPTEKKGVVTRAVGRTVYEIDSMPAATVYNRWLDGQLDDVVSSGGNVLARTTLNPLGRKVASAHADSYKLSHPDSISTEGAINLFSDVSEGDELVLMEGSRQSLISRAGRVADSAIGIGDFGKDTISGALVIYCAGCMLTVQDDMDKVADSINHALQGAPFISAYTFGEQGCFIDAGNSHGNLMISVVVFSQ